MKNFKMKILIIFFARFVKLTYSKDMVKKFGEFCILENGHGIRFNRTCPALGLEGPQDSAFKIAFIEGNFKICENPARVVLYWRKTMMAVQFWVIATVIMKLNKQLLTIAIGIYFFLYLAQTRKVSWLSLHFWTIWPKGCWWQDYVGELPMVTVSTIRH